MKLKTYFSGLFCLCLLVLGAQDYKPKNDGVKSKNTNFTAIINAKIYVTDSDIIENGTLLIQNGLVIDVGNDINIPQNSLTIDAKGNVIYPSFIDIFSNFGINKPKKVTSEGGSPQYYASREGYYWNDHIRAEQNSINFFEFDPKKANEYLEYGFGVVNTHLNDGIISGTGLLIALDINGDNSKRILKERSAQYLSFSRSSQSIQAYPTSIMGSMSLLRQFYHDVNWYEKGNINNIDITIESYIKNKNLVQIMSSGSRKNALRANKIADEFNLKYVILGGGDEYERITSIKNSNATYIIPINFPKPYDVENSFLAEKLETKYMRQWYQKPSNPKILAQNKIPFALTLHKLKSVKDFKANIIKALNRGFSKKDAIKSLTTTPARILKNNKIGNLNKGSYANFFISSGDFFNKNTSIIEHWIRGSRHIFDEINPKDLSGEYQLELEDGIVTVNFKRMSSTPEVIIKSNNNDLKSKLMYKDGWINLLFKSNDTNNQKYLRFDGKIDYNSDDIEGFLTDTNGNSRLTKLIKINNNITRSEKTKEKKDITNKNNVNINVTYPNVSFGHNKMPELQSLLFKNATVWTNEKEGILEKTDVIVKNGKIWKIGNNLKLEKAIVINAEGKHLTSGIIDEHSHIAAASINEAGQNSSAEVSIADVIEDDDIDIYRNLAGGVTTIQILHGSANPIGGRSAIIKLKWGEEASKLLYKNAPKFIKFALGENVKQSNWGGYTRFPQTRMGVEQLYIDYFSRALEYDNFKKSGKDFRYDIEMEVLSEILNKQRFISCHSYIQSEINMLMKVAEKYNFKINTFTHILEGYKVADKMKMHGAGASTFSDWWAYKYEVNDAIPYNAAILNNIGVITAINSDDAEMSRRLNQEAAKAVKYGGASEQDAWKMVTLNPAKLLRIDDKVGSIKVGKEADLVLWSGHPLSIYSKAEKTIIEGVTYFDLERDQKMRSLLRDERNNFIQMLLEAKSEGVKTQNVKIKKKKHMHCDTLDINEF